LIGFILGYARSIGETMAEGPVKDCVITVPSFYTQAEREAVLDAAATVKLNVLNLIDENTAAAIQFGVDRVFENTTHTVMYYNLGSHSLQVSIAQYSARQTKRLGKNITSSVFTVLAKTWDEGVGGKYFDMRVAHSLAEHFNNQMRNKKGSDPAYDVRKVQRGWAKIKAQAAKTKKVLSANDAIPVYISSVDKDLDLKGYKISRAQLEEMSKDLLDRVLGPVDQALAQANLTAADIDAVEIIGGGSRMPRVQQLLKERLNVEHLAVHLNGDEAMALGAAFHAANLSKAFRVRHVGMQDIQSIAIGVRLRGPPAEETGSAEVEAAAKSVKNWSKRATLFTVKSPRGSKKLVSFTHPRDFSCVLEYDGDVPEGASRSIRGYEVTGLEALLEEEKYAAFGLPKVNLAFFLDTQGIVAMVKADAVFEEIIEYEVQEEAPVDTDGIETSDGTETDTSAETADSAEDAVPESNDAAAAKEALVGEEAAAEGEKAAAEGEEAAAEGEEAAAEGEEAAAEGEEAAAEGEEAAAEGEEVAEPEPEPKKMITVTKTRKKKHRVALNIAPLQTDAPVFGVTHDWPLVGLRGGSPDLAVAHRLVESMDRADQHRQRHAEATNSLESFVYAARAFVRDEEFGAFEVTTEDERQEILDALEEAEDWLYEVDMQTPIDTIKDRRNTLTTRTEAIKIRVSELKARPAAIAALRAVLDAVTTQVGRWPDKKKQVTEEEIASLMHKVSSLSDWADEQEAAQAELGPTDEPAFKSEEVAKKAKGVEKKLRKLLAKPKVRSVTIQPPAPVVPKNDTAADTTSESTDKTVEADQTGAAETAEGSTSDEEGAEATSDAEGDSTEGGGGKDEL